MIGRQQPTNAPRTLPGDGLLQVGTWIGSVVFGWMHQPLWLAVPLIAFMAFKLVQVGLQSAWAKRELGLTTRQVFESWMSGLPFRGSASSRL
jgi:hypothetical protein